MSNDSLARWGIPTIPRTEEFERYLEMMKRRRHAADRSQPYGHRAGDRGHNPYKGVA